MQVLRSFMMLAVILLVWSQHGLAADSEDGLTIEVSQGRERAFSLALVPFQVQPGISLPEDLYKIIQSDIRYSGQLEAFPVSSMPALPVNSNQVIYADWQRSDTEYVLLGSIKVDAKSRYRVEYALHDVFGERLLRSETLFFNDRAVRDTAHLLSDLVYQEITGLKGIFSTKLAYITITGKRSQQPTFRLQLSDFDGKRPQVLLVSKQPILSPSWAPDSTRIAYVSFERGNSNIFVQNLLNGKRQLVSSFRGINGSPSWSPDGSRIAIVLSRGENTDIYVLELKSGQTTRITRDSGIDTEPSWSSDGRRLLFTSERAGSPHVFEADLQKKTITQLTDQGSYNTRGRYVENGRAFAYIRLVNGKYRLVKKSFVTGKIVALGQYGNDESPTVAPNGNAVAYSTEVYGSSKLVVVSTDGFVEYFLPVQATEVIEPAWSNFRI